MLPLICPDSPGLVGYIQRSTMSTRMAWKPRPGQLAVGLSSLRVSRIFMPGCCVQRRSLSLGRWWGVSVYLHIFFLFSALLALAFTLPDSELMVAGLLAVRCCW